MKFHSTPLKGVYLIESEQLADERGFFARTWCRKEAESLNLNSHIEQCSVSFNKQRGTLRGLHYQREPYAETKLVRCTVGAIYDVVVDLRQDSATYGKWIAYELSAMNRRQLYIPQGCAHGFQTLMDDTEVYYQISMEYHPEAACGIRWNDPSLNIPWPEKISNISIRDSKLPLLACATEQT